MAQERDYSRIRKFVSKAIAERRALANNLHAEPSPYWSDFSRFSEYVRELADAQLAFIRYHTYHLTADGYVRYYVGSAADRAPLIEEFEWLSRKLDGFAYAEGSLGIGFETRYGKINTDLLRYLGVVLDLKNAAAISRTGNVKILEIGGGFGGLASVIMHYNPQATYTITDIEETLFFSAVHLTNVLGADRVVLCDADTPMAARPGTVFLLPQSRRPQAEGLKLDLVINQQSMQEMTKDQVIEYCDFIGRSARLFYSCNLDYHNKAIRERTAIVSNLTSLLRSKFRLIRWESPPRPRLPARIASKSSVLSKAYLAVTGEPAMRSSDVWLRRIVFDCESCATRSQPSQGQQASIG